MSVAARIRPADFARISANCYLAAMKFSLDDGANGYAIQSYDEQGVVINRRLFTQSLVLLPDQLIDHWRPQRFDDLQEPDFDSLARLGPDLVLLGTGNQQRFPSPLLYRSLVATGIGMEIMGTPAACRTYNILMSEGRRVAAALLLSD